MVNDRLLVKNLGIAAAVVIAVLVFGSIVGNPGEIDEPVVNQCLRGYMMAIEIEPCYYENYAVNGFDSAEQCVMNYLNRLPDC